MDGKVNTLIWSLQYLDSENINYENSNFEKESKSKKDAILQIDF